MLANDFPCQVASPKQHYKATELGRHYPAVSRTSGYRTSAVFDDKWDIPASLLFIAFGGFLFLGCEQGLFLGFFFGSLGLHDGTPGPDWACMAGVKTVLWGVGILHSPPTSMPPEYRPAKRKNLFYLSVPIGLGSPLEIQVPALSFKRLVDS